jgi:hypothetical protein
MCDDFFSVRESSGRLSRHHQSWQVSFSLFMCVATDGRSGLWHISEAGKDIRTRHTDRLSVLDEVPLRLLQFLLRIIDDDDDDNSLV